jgi:hypothetical protein
MGEAKQRKARLASMLQEHPFCCFCGGTVAATTIEHAPPIVFFINKQRPKSYEFPACARCNNGSGPADQIAALVMGSASRNDIPSEYVMRVARGVRNNQPKVVQWLTGDTRPFWVEHKGVPVPKVAARMPQTVNEEWLNPWAAKQGFALWFQHTGRILGLEARVSVRWFTNYDVAKNEWPREFVSVLPNTAMLKMRLRTSRDEFIYK